MPTATSSLFKDISLSQIGSWTSDIKDIPVIGVPDKENANNDMIRKLRECSNFDDSANYWLLLAPSQGVLDAGVAITTILSPFSLQRWLQQSKKEDPWHGLGTIETMDEHAPARESTTGTSPSTANAPYWSRQQTQNSNI